MTWTDSTQEEPSPASAAVFFDARRGIYYARPVLRGWLHVVWFGLSVVAGPVLLAGAHGAQQITARAIYATSVTALFGVSALYHRGHWTESGRRRMQRLDHMMIFFLIAGTATPVLLLTSPGAFGLACLIAVWALAAAASVVHMMWMGAPELLVGAVFVGLGWVAALALPGLWIHAARHQPRWCSRAACSTRPGRSATAAAGPILARQCSATTRYSTPSSALPRCASSPRSPSWSANQSGGSQLGRLRRGMLPRALCHRRCSGCARTPRRRRPPAGGTVRPASPREGPR